MPLYKWQFPIAKSANFPLLTFLNKYAAEARTNHSVWRYWSTTNTINQSAVYIDIDKTFHGFVMYDEFASGIFPAPFLNSTCNVVIDDDADAEFINRRLYLTEGLPRYLIEYKSLTEYLETVPELTYFGFAQFLDITGDIWNIDPAAPGWSTKSSFLSAYGDYKVISDIKAYTASGEYIGSLLTDAFIPCPFVSASSTGIYRDNGGTPEKLFDTTYEYYINTLTALVPQFTQHFAYAAPYSDGDVLVAKYLVYGSNATSLNTPALIFPGDVEMGDFISGTSGMSWTFDPDVVIDPAGDMNNTDYIGPQSNQTGGTYVIGVPDIPMPEGTEFDGGNYDPTSAVIGTGDIVAPGFSPSQASGLTTWAISGDELFNVSQEIFKPELDLTKIFISKDKAFINCFFLPFDILAHDSSHCSLQQFNIGYATTTLQLYRVMSGYNNMFDGGSVNVREYYGSFMDYAPYTSVTIYIPYIGYQELDTNMVMNRTLTLKYSVDFTMGILTAYLFAGSTLINMFSGQMGIPTGINGMDLAQAFQSLVKFIGITAVSVPAIAQGAAGLVQEAAAGGIGAETAATMGAVVGAPAIAGLATAAGMSATQPAARSMGNAGAENWLSAYQTPYIIIERRESATPAKMVDLEGYAACFTDKVSAFTGFVQASTIKLQNAAGITEEENKMIFELLKGGIYID